MCFSANASFGAGIVVASAGVLSTTSVKYRAQIMFAAIPLIFATQQMMEGWVWLSITNNELGQGGRIPVTLFLFFAQVVWPVWLPVSLRKIEPIPRLRHLLWILCICSVALAPIQAYRLFFYTPTVEVSQYHIKYGLDFSIPYLRVILNAFYFMTTTVPPFLSSRKSVRILGILNLGAFIVSALAYRTAIISVWCFFAALISWQVVQVMREMRNETKVAWQ
jgi:hypothetical protein